MHKGPLFKLFIAAALLIIIIAAASGCGPKEAGKPTPPTYTPTPVEPAKEPATDAPPPVNKPVSDYIPLKVGSKWEYIGEGNEFASYTQEVIFQKDNRFQLATDTGGTVMANIFEVREDRILNIYQMGEEYDHKNLLNEESNLNVTLLKKPLQVGNKWISEENVYEIIDTKATVTVPYGTFSDCIIVKLTYKDGSESYMHYKDGIGMLQSEFISGDFRVFSRLNKFTSK